jgi:hypothetical protein
MQHLLGWDADGMSGANLVHSLFGKGQPLGARPFVGSF